VTTMSAGMQYVYVGGKGTVTALNGGTQMVYSGGTSLATTINSGGTMLYGAGAQAEDTTVNGGTIQLEDVDKAGGTVYALGNVTATDGIINVAANDYAKKDYSTANRSLSLTSLTGTATFVINTDLANNTGDTISIGTANNATANIKVGYDPFYDIATKNQTLSGTYQVLSKGSGTLTVNSVQTDWGALRFTPTIVDNGDGTYSTVAIKENSFDPSENIMTAADARAVLNEAWFQTVNSLSKRLGDIRSNNNSEDGIWARFQRSNNKAKGDREAKLNGNLFQIGYDKAFSRADGKTYVGVAVDHLDGTGSYANGSGKTKGTSFAIYDTWMGHTGHYYDVVARYGHFSNDYTLTDLSETISDADYGVNAWSLSGEYGYRKQLKNGMYIEPQGEIIYGRVGSGDYTTSLKWPVSVDATNHFITRLGIAVGKESKNSSYYAKA
ncbi:MAG: autotransporter outer membrane beta-barrel domain-containing protein, partial [Acidaminococcaceae bacterium]|nr:autotransporter outer membrane beta-barrel domain-containing protein [Acidaminococcaceae bacterium]